MQGWGSNVQGDPVPEPEKRLGNKRGVTSGIASGEQNRTVFILPAILPGSLLFDAIVNGIVFIVVKYTS